MMMRRNNPYGWLNGMASGDMQSGMMQQPGMQAGPMQEGLMRPLDYGQPGATPMLGPDMNHVPPMPRDVLALDYKLTPESFLSNMAQQGGPMMAQAQPRRRY